MGRPDLATERSKPFSHATSPAQSELCCRDTRTWDWGMAQPCSWPGPLPTARTFCLVPSQEQLGHGFQATQLPTASAKPRRPRKMLFLNWLAPVLAVGLFFAN